MRTLIALVTLSLVWGCSSGQNGEQDGNGGTPDGSNDRYTCQRNEWCLVTQNFVAGTKTDLWGFSSDDVWVVGASSVRHWNGTRWEDVAAPAADLSVIWGRSSTELLVGGDAGALFYWNGSQLSPIPGIGGTDNVASIWGLASGPVWIGGFSIGAGKGFVYRWDGEALTPEALGTTGSIMAFWGSSNTDVMAFGWGDTNNTQPGAWRYDGTTWSPMATGATKGIVAAWGMSATSVWALGQNPEILHWNGSSWSLEQTPVGFSARSIHGRDTAAWIVNGSLVMRLEGQTWQVEHAAGDPWLVERNTQGVMMGGYDILNWGAGSPWVAPNGDVWAVADSHVMKRLGPMSD